jgi:hypothetical protein
MNQVSEDSIKKRYHSVPTPFPLQVVDDAFPKYRDVMAETIRRAKERASIS